MCLTVRLGILNVLRRYEHRGLLVWIGELGRENVSALTELRLQRMGGATLSTRLERLSRLHATIMANPSRLDAEFPNSQLNPFFLGDAMTPCKGLMGGESCSLWTDAEATL